MTMREYTDRHQYTVLVVDDQATMRFLATEALQQAGFIVEQASNGTEALTSIAHSTPDLVLLDLMMPVMDGYVVCEMLRSHAETRHLPVLMMTGLDDEKSIMRAYDAGATDFIGKPFKGFVLSQRVRAILRARHTEQKMHQLAYYDSLTSLPNRESFKNRLVHTISLAKRHARLLSILYLDIDDFKRINDTLGHSVGDLLLKEVAARLIESVRECDIVTRSGETGEDEDFAARLGGDEFIVLLSEIESSHDAAIVAKRIIERLSRSFNLDGYEVYITPSIGIAVYPQDAEDSETLLKNADAAMYAAKQGGKNGFEFYDGTINEETLRRLNIDNALRGAMERDEFFLNYQPQVDAISGRIRGMEALLRWRNQALGAISPAEFIPVAEENGLIVDMGEWVLRTACIQAKKWQDQGLFAGRMSVNISVLQFAKRGFVDLIENVLEETGLEAYTLELEITESLLAKDVNGAIETLRALKSLGVQLAIDDFGTGYSSLSYLKRFPIDHLKIDRSFVRDVTSEPDDAAIARAITAMARSMHLGVIAEGVETEAQLEFLSQQGCREIQGYYFSPPLSTDDMACFLKENLKTIDKRRAKSLEQRTVLFLDDDDIILDAISQVLADEDYRVLTVSNAQDAFDMLALNKIDIMVADYQMPDMNGTEFLNRVRRLFPDTVRIMLSGESDMQTIITAVNSGALYKFLEKPIRWDVLCDTLQEVFETVDAGGDIRPAVASA